MHRIGGCPSAARTLLGWSLLLVVGGPATADERYTGWLGDGTPLAADRISAWPVPGVSSRIAGRNPWDKTAPLRFLRDTQATVAWQPPYLVLATRKPNEHGLSSIDGLLAYGASPRASIGLVRAARALALIRGRAHALPQDVYDVAFDVLNHRLVPSFDAVADGVTVDDIVVEVLSTVKAPRHLTSGRAGTSTLPTS